MSTRDMKKLATWFSGLPQAFYDASHLNRPWVMCDEHGAEVERFETVVDLSEALNEYVGSLVSDQKELLHSMHEYRRGRSDDDLCHACVFAVQHQTNTEDSVMCQKIDFYEGTWPGKVDADGYIIDCEEYSQ